MGVHSPEFFWERGLNGVKHATIQLGINFPVVQDNSFSTWKRYSIWAWPTIVLIDKRGISRYSHVGEGAYRQTEALIKELLADGT